MQPTWPAHRILASARVATLFGALLLVAPLAAWAAPSPPTAEGAAPAAAPTPPSPAPAPKGGKGTGKKAQEPGLPPVKARLRVTAPSAQGEWLVRIDNEDDEPLRIAADVRLLRLEVRPAKETGYGKKKRVEWAKKPIVCDGPAAFGLEDKYPAERELLLEPGQSWVEQLDPRLICFGEQAKLLTGGTLVSPVLGWPAKAAWGKAASKELVAADATQSPRRASPLRQLEGPSMVLSWAPPSTEAATIETRPMDPPAEPGAATPAAQPTSQAPGSTAVGPAAQPSGGPTPSATGPGAAPSQPAGSTPTTAAPGAAAPASTGETPGAAPPGPQGQAPAGAPAADGPAPPKDDLGARLAMTAKRFSDALYPRDAVVSVQVHNAGERSGMVALRGRQLSFEIRGPDGIVSCPRKTVSHVVPPDLFQKLGEGKHVQFDLLLAEICPRSTFRRPGLYVITPTIHADERDREQRLNTITGVVSTKPPDAAEGAQKTSGTYGGDVTLLRVKRGPESLRAAKPSVVPTAHLDLPAGGGREEQPPSEPAAP